MNHNIYGSQLKISSYEMKEPEDLISIERYLGSGAIKGVGAALAGRIVRKFKTDTFRIIEEEPERLAEVNGISERKARRSRCRWMRKRNAQSDDLFTELWNQYSTGSKNLSEVWQ